MQEKKEPAKITWRGAFWLVVVAVAISGLLCWNFGKEAGYEEGHASGYSEGYETGKSNLQQKIPDMCQESYNHGYEKGLEAAASKTTGNDYNTQERPDNSQQASDEQCQTVYITNTGEKYHRDGCQYLRQSKIAISLDDAINQGYTACSRCW